MAAMYLIYVPVSNEEEAKRIGKQLVQERLAACVNIFPQITSYYWWENQLCEDKESVLIVKTSKELLEAVYERIQQLHSYTTPAILTLPVEKVNQNYLQWLHNEVKTP